MEEPDQHRARRGLVFGPASASIPPPACRPLPVGNPEPDFDNAARPGANLFTDLLVALDARNRAAQMVVSTAQLPTTATGTPTSSRRSTALTEANS